MLIALAASALGISDGPVVADVMQQDGILQLVELLPRLSAKGEFLDAAIAWASGESVSPEQLAVQINEERSARPGPSLFATHQK